MSFINNVAVFAGLLWGISEVICVIFLRRNEKDGRDKVSYKAITLVSWVCFTAGINMGIYYMTGKRHFPCCKSNSLIFPYAGTAFLLAGMAVRAAAILTLRRFFTVNVTIQDGHEIIRDGLYRFVRHPSYFGSLMACFGLAISFGNAVVFLIIFFPFAAIMLGRMSAEEKVLTGHFGDKYREYMTKTKRIIPFVY